MILVGGYSCYLELSQFRAQFKYFESRLHDDKYREPTVVDSSTGFTAFLHDILYAIAIKKGEANRGASIEL